MPEQEEIPVFIEADVCPDHPRGYELCERERSAPRVSVGLIAAA